MRLTEQQTSAVRARNVVRTGLYTGIYAGCKQTFTPIGDVADLLRLAEAPAHDWHGLCESRSNRNSTWAGSSNWNEAVDMLTSGWPAGLTKAKSLAKSLTHRPLLAAYRLESRPSVMPYRSTALHVGHYASGRPDHMIARRSTGQQQTGRDIVRIAVNIRASFAVDPEVLTARAATIGALVLLLTRAGRQVAVTMTDCTAYQHNIHVRTWQVVKPGVGFDLNRLLFAIGHPSMLRRIMFAIDEVMVDAAARGGDPLDQWGYGRPESLTTCAPDIAKSQHVVVDSNCSIDDNGNELIEWTRPEHQVRWIRYQLRGQGFRLA